MFRITESVVGVGLVVLATVLLAFRSILVKMAYAVDVGVLDLLYYRFLFAIPMLFGFAYYQKRSALWTTILEWRIAIPCVLAGVFGYYLATLLDFYSLHVIDANMNRMIVYSFPVYVLFINAFLEKKWPDSRTMMTFLLVQLGLFVVLGGFSFEFTGGNKEGVLYAFFAALSYAVYIVLNQETGKKIGSVLFTTYAIGFSFCFIVVHFAVMGGVGLVSLEGFLIIAVMSVFCTFLPLLLVSEGIQRIGGTRFALINASGPLMTLGFAYLLLGELMAWWQFAAAFFVVIVLVKSEMDRG